MRFDFLFSKIHRATITQANLNYIGSITIDKTLLDAAKMRAGQKVEILDIDNGERFSTYIIEGQADTGEIRVNGAAARKVHIGDKIIIVAYGSYEADELENYEPTVVFVNDENAIVSVKNELLDV